MNADTIREWLQRAPFEPFVIKVSDGDMFEVRHPENAILLKSRLLLGYPKTDRAVHVDLVHINSIEAMKIAQQENQR